LEVIGALSVALIILLTIFSVQYRATADARSADVERRAQYMAGALRVAFETQLDILRSDYERHGFLRNLGLSGELLSADANTPANNRRIVPFSTANLSARLKSALPGVPGDPPDEITAIASADAGANVPDGATLSGAGLIPAGISYELDASVMPGATPPVTGGVPIKIYYGRIRPDALVAGLCEPGQTGRPSVDADGDGNDGFCDDNNQSDGDPEYGYVPVNVGTRTMPTRTGVPVQIVYPFLGYYESTAGGDVSKVLVTDDTALALVVKTDFTYPLIGSPSAPDPDAIDREVLARAAELLAPYGGWGVVPGAPGPLERGFSSFYNCLPHITDIRRIQRTASPNALTGCTGNNLYSAENGAIVAPRLAWRYLARELPFQDPSYSPAVPGSIQHVFTSTDVPGQLFMIALLGRRSNPQLALESMDVVASGTPNPSNRDLYFAGENGLLDAPPTANFASGRNFGFVFAKSVEVGGDLVVDADGLIEGAMVGSKQVLVLPGSGVSVEGGHFTANSPYDSDGVLHDLELLVIDDARVRRLEFLDR
jgi:hypothetical protein